MCRKIPCAVRGIVISFLSGLKDWEKKNLLLIKHLNGAGFYIVNIKMDELKLPVKPFYILSQKLTSANK